MPRSEPQLVVGARLLALAGVIRARNSREGQPSTLKLRPLNFPHRAGSEGPSPDLMENRAVPVDNSLPCYEVKRRWCHPDL